MDYLRQNRQDGRQHKCRYIIAYVIVLNCQITVNCLSHKNAPEGNEAKTPDGQDLELSIVDTKRTTKLDPGGYGDDTIID